MHPRPDPILRNSRATASRRWGEVAQASLQVACPSQGVDARGNAPPCDAGTLRKC